MQAGGVQCHLDLGSTHVLFYVVLFSYILQPVHSALVLINLVLWSASSVYLLFCSLTHAFSAISCKTMRHCIIVCKVQLVCARVRIAKLCTFNYF